MSLEGRLQVVTAPNTIFLGSEVGDFAIKSVNGIHLGVSPIGVTVPAHVRIDEQGVTINEPVNAGVVSGTFVTAAISARDGRGIEVTSQSGGPVSVSSGVGGIRLDTVSGNINVASQSGNVTLAASTGTVSVTSGTGIQLDGVRVDEGTLVADRLIVDGSVEAQTLTAQTLFLPKATVSGSENRTTIALSSSAPLLEVAQAGGMPATLVVDSIQATSVQGTDVSFPGTATLGALTLGSSSSSAVIVVAPTLDVSKPVSLPSVRMGPLSVEPAAWGARNTVAVRDGATTALLECAGIAVVQSDRSAAPVAMTNSGGTVAAVNVDNGLLSRPAPMSASTLTLRAGATGPATTISSTASGLVCDSSLRLPGVVMGSATAMTETVGGGITFAGGDLTATGLKIPGGGALSGGAGKLIASTTIAAPGLALLNGVTATTASLSTDTDGGLRATATALRLQGSQQIVTVDPIVGATRVTPAALDLGSGDGNWTRIDARPDGLHIGSATLHAAGTSFTATSGTLAVSGVSGISLGNALTLSATATGAKLTNDSLTLGQAKSKLTAEAGGFLLSSPAADATVRSATSLALQAPANVSLVLQRSGGGTWSRFAFEAGSKGELKVNGRNVGVTPYDALSTTAAVSASPDASGWFTFIDAFGATVFRARRYDGQVPNLVRATGESFSLPGFSDAVYSGSTVTTYVSPLGGTTTYRAAWVDVHLSVPVSLKRLQFALADQNQYDRRPASWRLFARTGAPSAAEVGNWVEVLRGGAVAVADSSSDLPVYDCYRLAVSAVTAGSSICVSQLQLWGLAAAPEVQPQSSFTGQHLVVPVESEPLTSFKPGMIVVSGGEGHDSIDIGGMKARGGAAAITLDSALPRVRLSGTARDPTVFGVVSGTTVNRWVSGYMDRRLVVNGLGEGAILVVDTDGPIRNGDLLATSSVPGHASRQGSDVVSNFTAAKATMACDFRPAMVPVLEMAMLDGVPFSATDDLVAWTTASPAAMQPEYRVFELPGGIRAALISCTYRCS